MIGSGDDSDYYKPMSSAQIDFFNAQGVQGPPIIVDTSWLFNRHVDEVFQVVPNHNAEPGERPWAIVIGSPSLAVALLEEALEKGFGSKPVFDRDHISETTIHEILADSRLMALNDYAQRKIDTVRERLIAEAGLAETDFREVPALFRLMLIENGTEILDSYMPNMQNLLVVDDVLFFSDPEGPDVDGTDIWQQAALEAVDGLGLETHFVDVFYSYYVLSGAIHCGTNVEHTGSTTPWWLGADLDAEDSQ